MHSLPNAYICYMYHVYEHLMLSYNYASNAFQSYACIHKVHAFGLHISCKDTCTSVCCTGDAAVQSLVESGIMKQFDVKGVVYCSYADYDAEEVEECYDNQEFSGEDSFFLFHRCLHIVDERCLNASN